MQTTHSLAFDIRRESAPIHDGVYVMTGHAMGRMYERSLRASDVQSVLERGQPVYDRGGILFRVGRRVAAELRAEGLPADRLEGLQVVVSPDRLILTVYRNHDFRRPRKTRKPAWRRRSVSAHQTTAAQI